MVEIIPSWFRWGGIKRLSTGLLNIVHELFEMIQYRELKNKFISYVVHLVYSCSNQPCRRCKSSSKQGFMRCCTLATEQRSSLYVALLKWSSWEEKNVLYYHPQRVSFDSVCSIVGLKIIFCILTPCSKYIRKKNQELPDHDPCKRNVWLLWGLHWS